MEMYIQDDVEWSESLRDHIVQSLIALALLESYNYSKEACEAIVDVLMNHRAETLGHIFSFSR